MWQSVRDGARRWHEPPPLGCADPAVRGCCAVRLRRYRPVSRPPSPTASPLKAEPHGRADAGQPSASMSAFSSSYGGAYDDPKLEALIGKTVDRLVAASDRPGPGLQGDHPQFRRGERLRAADRPALRDARPDRAGQRHLRIVLGAEPRDGACAGKARLDPRGPGAAGRGGHPRRHRHEQRSRSDARWRWRKPS